MLHACAEVFIEVCVKILCPIACDALCLSLNRQEPNEKILLTEDQNV
jgi:hypothetical protein